MLSGKSQISIPFESVAEDLSCSFIYNVFPVCSLSLTVLVSVSVLTAQSEILDASQTSVFVQNAILVLGGPRRLVCAKYHRALRQVSQESVLLVVVRKVGVLDVWSISSLLTEKLRAEVYLLLALR